MIDYEIAILIGAIAFVYSVLLTEPNAPLNRAYNFLYSAFKTDERAEQGKPVHWIFMLLMYCERCIAGQLAFWHFIYNDWQLYFVNPEVAFLIHFGSVSVSIITAATLKILYKHKQ